MTDVEYVVNFGSDKSIQFVKLSMAEVEHHGARLGEPIVRCRDCRYYREKHGLCAGFGYEWNGELVQVEPDGFCKWAEREER